MYIYIHIYIFIHQYIHSWFATKIQVQTTHGEKLVKNRSGNTLSYNECWNPSDCFTNSFPQDVREKLEMPQWQRSVEGEVNRHGHHGCGNLSAHKKHMAMGSWARKRARWWVTFAFFGVGLVFFFWGRNSQRGELFSEEFVWNLCVLLVRTLDHLLSGFHFLVQSIGFQTLQKIQQKFIKQRLSVFKQHHADAL